MKMGLVRKIVAGMTAVSVVTYGCSALFIFYLKDWIAPGMADWSFVSIVLMLGVIWTAILGWIGAVWLTRPLIRLAAAADQAATGNLRVEIPEHASDDEIRRLSVSFAKMIEGLRGMIAGLSENVAFNRHQAGALSGGMDQAAHQIERIAGTTETIARGAAEQAESAAGTLEAVTRIRSAAADIDGKAGQTRSTSREMLRTIVDSGGIVRSLAEGMMKLADSSGESLAIVRELEGHAKQIRGISQVVGTIADQTHLLALNAAIEAARAGESGASFAVVAGEIRKLAEESSQAVKRIEGLISRIETGVAEVVGKTAAQEALARRESSKGDAANAALVRIGSAVRETARSVEEIAVSIADQMKQAERVFAKTRGVEEIAGRISEDIKQASASMQEQMSVMQELAASSEMLGRQADDLNVRIKVFVT